MKYLDSSFFGPLLITLNFASNHYVYGGNLRYQLKAFLPSHCLLLSCATEYLLQL